MNQEDLHAMVIYQKRYFEILTEFFITATGQLPRDFSTLDDFSESVRSLSSKVTEKSINAYYALENSLNLLYSDEAANVFRSAMNIDANKLNLGGGSRFLKTHLEATRKSLLFSDIVLIPDPIMPWLERKREEERFRLVIPLQMAFFILHLSDLLEDGFDIPPFFVFPSFEKTLEDHDIQTQENKKQLITEVFSYYIDSGIEEAHDIVEFATRHPDLYFNRIENSKLFVSPGAEPGESIRLALENYKKHMKQWRSEEWCNSFFKLSDIEIVTNAIIERITPNFHLIENSDELRSHPFLCIDAQAHYYQLIANMKNQKISASGSFDLSTTAILNSLTSTRLDFLANITDSQIVELRKTNENVAFRRELRDLVNSLPHTKIEDLGYVSSEVCAHIELAISKHRKEVEIFNEKYNAKHKYTALLGIGTLGVTMFPVLAPFIGAVLPIGLAATTGKYASDKFDEIAEGKQYSHSMMGIISLAKKNAR